MVLLAFSLFHPSGMLTASMLSCSCKRRVAAGPYYFSTLGANAWSYREEPETSPQDPQLPASLRCTRVIQAGEEEIAKTPETRRANEFTHLSRT